MTQLFSKCSLNTGEVNWKMGYYEPECPKQATRAGGFPTVVSRQDYEQVSNCKERMLCACWGLQRVRTALIPLPCVTSPVSFGDRDVVQKRPEDNALHKAKAKYLMTVLSSISWPFHQTICLYNLSKV